VDGQVYARGSSYTCQVLVAPGQYPNNARTSASPPGDFKPVGNGWCDGSDPPHSAEHAGALGQINIAQLRARFPVGTDFSGPEPQASVTDGNGRPNPAPACLHRRDRGQLDAGRVAMSGSDRRAAYLHHDAATLPGSRAPSPAGADHERGADRDGESSPVLADLNGDNRAELISSLGPTASCHAIEPNGSELPGWPVRGDVPGIVANHLTARAYSSVEIVERRGARSCPRSPGDANGDGVRRSTRPTLLTGNVYAGARDGTRVFPRQSNPASRSRAPFRQLASRR